MALEPRVNDLAATFLPEDAPEADKANLSQYIQNAIDEWLEDNGYGPDKDDDGEAEAEDVV